MAIDLPKRDPGAILPPRKGEVTLAADQSGNPVLIDEGGSVNQPFAFNGSPVQLFEQVADPAPIGNGAILYSKLIDGVREVFARVSDGTVRQITPASAAPTLLWKGGTPGNYFVAGDVINLEHNSIAMISFVQGEALTINMPAITAASAGQICGIINQFDKKADFPPDETDISIVPAPADKFYAGAVGETVTDLSGGSFAISATWMSDGVGTWIHRALGAPGIFAPIPV